MMFVPGAQDIQGEDNPVSDPKLIDVIHESTLSRSTFIGTVTHKF